MLKPFKVVEEQEVFDAQGRIRIIQSKLITSDDKKSYVALCQSARCRHCASAYRRWSSVSQKRMASEPKRLHSGLPSGVVDTKDAGPQDTARRECQEEVGMKPGTLTKLITVYPTNHIHAQYHIFLAEHLKQSNLKGDEHEHLETQLLSFRNAQELILEKQIPTMQDALAFSLVSELRKN
jgi:ADP-ribose pyrophosphatase YjhB (NUDIX family)